jgi:hypothetical protein
MSLILSVRSFQEALLPSENCNYAKIPPFYDKQLDILDLKQFLVIYYCKKSLEMLFSSNLNIKRNHEIQEAEAFNFVRDIEAKMKRFEK